MESAFGKWYKAEASADIIDELSYNEFVYREIGYYDKSEKIDFSVKPTNTSKVYLTKWKKILKTKDGVRFFYIYKVCCIKGTPKNLMPLEIE